MPDERLPLGLVVAMSDNRVIGNDGRLPWHIPEDLRHFRRVTTGHAIIMGRRTHESIGRPLPKRRNVVVSSRPRPIAGCEVAPSLDEAVRWAREGGDPMPMVIGGASVYEQALPHVTHLFVTEVAGFFEGDAFFPPVDGSAFREVSRRAGETGGVSFVEYERADPGR